MTMLRWPLPALLAWVVGWALFMGLNAVGAPLMVSIAAGVAGGAACSAAGNTPWRRVFIVIGFPLSLAASDWFGRSQSWSNPGYAEKLGLFGISEDHEGECFDNTLKILRLLETHPDLALFVQASPAFCCPSIITEAMSKEIERVTGVPVVTVTYDGTGSPKNDAVAPYLAFARKGSAAPR